MAKLEPYVESFDLTKFDTEFVPKLMSGVCDESVDGHNMTESGLTRKKIVEGYLVTGKYINIDCPGGISKLVEDYRNGDLD